MFLIIDKGSCLFSPCSSISTIRPEVSTFLSLHQASDPVFFIFAIIASSLSFSICFAFSAFSLARSLKRLAKVLSNLEPWIILSKSLRFPIHFVILASLSARLLILEERISSYFKAAEFLVSTLRVKWTILPNFLARVFNSIFIDMKFSNNLSGESVLSIMLLVVVMKYSISSSSLSKSSLNSLHSKEE